MLDLSSNALRHLEGVFDRLGDSRTLQQHLAELVALNGTLTELVERDLDALLGEIPGQAGDASRHLLEAGGKRLRPLLALLASGASGARPEKGLPVAVAVEMLHSGSLLHDDVVDEGEVRRGRPAANTIYGNPVAVLAGDFCLFAALDSLLRLNDFPLMERTVQVARDLTEAELWQLERRGRASLGDEDAYFGIIERKTGSLFALATFGGARTAWAPDGVTSSLDAFGREIGVAFQIVDDLLDLGGDPEEVGKGLGADLMQGTITLPLLYAAQESPAVREDLERLMRMVLDGADVDTLAASARHVSEAASSTEAVARAKAAAERRTGEALARLEALPPSPYREALVLLSVGLIDRVR